MNYPIGKPSLSQCSGILLQVKIQPDTHFFSGVQKMRKYMSLLNSIY